MRKPLKKNPLRNLGALLKLNPYAKQARRAELLSAGKGECPHGAWCAGLELWLGWNVLCLGWLVGWPIARRRWLAGRLAGLKAAAGGRGQQRDPGVAGRLGRKPLTHSTPTPLLTCSQQGGEAGGGSQGQGGCAQDRQEDLQVLLLHHDHRLGCALPGGGLLAAHREVACPAAEVAVEGLLATLCALQLTRPLPVPLPAHV